MLTDRLKLEVREEWEQIVASPFAIDLANGTLPLFKLERYLVQDHRFLDAFVVLLASMIAQAPTLEQRVPGCQFLAVITGKENTYFERAFVELNAKVDVPDEPATTEFLQLMRSAAQSQKLHVMLAVLVVAEWSYLTWAENVQVADDLPWIFKEWIDLHTGDYFSSVVTYLRGLLDSLPLDDAQEKETKDAFIAAVRAEQAFWEMALE